MCASKATSHEDNGIRLSRTTSGDHRSEREMIIENTSDDFSKPVSCLEAGSGLIHAVAANLGRVAALVNDYINLRCKFSSRKFVFSSLKGKRPIM